MAPLARLLAGIGAAQEQAAAAIAHVSSPEANQRPLIKAGVVLPLVWLLRGGTSTSQVCASRAIGNLACNRDGQEQIHRAGGVRSLLALLGSGKAQELAARALARLACDNLPIQLEICKAGGVASLIALLSDINTEVQLQACAAISELCQGAGGGKNRRKTQDALAKAGGIAPLLALVQINVNHQTLIAKSVHALAMVARSNRANQVHVSTALHEPSPPSHALLSRPARPSHAPFFHTLLSHSSHAFSRLLTPSHAFSRLLTRPCHTSHPLSGCYCHGRGRQTAC